jgi:hypothetical protein
MTTPKKRSHKNNPSRTTAEERADLLLDELTVATAVVKGIKRRLMVSDSLATLILIQQFEAHAAATLDRKKRRAT